VVDVADSDIRRVKKYQMELRNIMTVAMEYCSTLVDRLPGRPVPLSRGRYHADPLVKAVFISADQLLEVLDLAMNVESSADKAQGGERFALLSMLRTERTIFGREQQGDLMVADVAKQKVNFVDHLTGNGTYAFFNSRKNQISFQADDTSANSGVPFQISS
jgi:hypothetical protein